MICTNQPKMYQPKVTSEVPAATSPHAPEEPVPSLEKAVQELPSDIGGCGTTPVTPEPRVPTYPEISEPKFKHATHKSRRVGFFCRDCKQCSTDPSWFRHQPCVPDEYKSPEDDVKGKVSQSDNSSFQLKVRRKNLPFWRSWNRKRLAWSDFWPLNLLNQFKGVMIKWRLRWK